METRTPVNPFLRALRRGAALVFAAVLMSGCGAPAIDSSPPDPARAELPKPSAEPSASVITDMEIKLQGSAQGDSAFIPEVAQGLRARWKGRQAIVVRADSASAAGASVWLLEEKGGRWQATAGPMRAVVGKKGVDKKREGDQKAPSGAFLLGTTFGWASAPAGVSWPYRKLTAADRWVDASASPFYNHWVRGSAKACGSGEALQSTDVYKHAIVVHYNDEAKPGIGSAIFLHVWKGEGRGTSGCTAMSEVNLEKVMRWMDYSKRPVLVQGTGDEILRLMAQNWNIQCLPSGWGYADDFIADLQPEFRYFTAENFTGAPLPGYGAPEAILRMEAIKALQKAATSLRARGIGIRIFDAYRPQKATDAMMAWARSSDTSTKALYYPDIPKSKIPGTYVASSSTHVRGGTVDLTLVKWSTGANLDMGGRFDFFGARSAYGYKGLTAQQAGNRKLLRTTLKQAGFQPYDREWWHFTYSVNAVGKFLIQPRQYLIQ